MAIVLCKLDHVTLTVTETVTLIQTTIIILNHDVPYFTIEKYTCYPLKLNPNVPSYWEINLCSPPSVKHPDDPMIPTHVYHLCGGDLLEHNNIMKIYVFSANCNLTS